jgi:2-oxoglutarate ferredoxin oxidoreductase subunit alpha
MCECARKIIIPEMNLGQIFHEVERIAKNSVELAPVNKIGGEIITPEEILEKIVEKNG